MTEIELARKRGKHNLKRKREHRLKVILSKTKEGRSLWNTRKHGKFVSQLIGMGYTQKEALQKAGNVFVFLKAGE